MSPQELRNVLEAALLAAGRALSLDDFLALFEGSPEAPDRAALREALDELAASLEGRALELKEVASGYRLQVRQAYSTWLGGLFAERPPRYSRALLETLALIAYRQPITRGEIEDVRGVAVSTNIIKTLMEREWIRVLGHREVPGRPALYGTTRGFLDHFGLKGLDGLPPLADIRDLDQVEPDLFASLPAQGEAAEEDADAPEGAAQDASGAPVLSGESDDGEAEDATFDRGTGEGVSEGPETLSVGIGEDVPDAPRSGPGPAAEEQGAQADGTAAHPRESAEVSDPEPEDSLSLGGAASAAEAADVGGAGDTGDEEQHPAREDAAPRSATGDGGAGR